LLGENASQLEEVNVELLLPVVLLVPLSDVNVELLLPVVELLVPVVLLPVVLLGGRVAHMPSDGATG